MRREKSNDILIIARLFINPEGFGLIVPPGWWADVSALAQTLRKQTMELIVVGPLSVLDFGDLHACDIAPGGSSSCDMERAVFAPLIRQVYDGLYVLRSVKCNVHAFNAFDVLCPDAQRICPVFNERVATYWDRHHLYSQGAARLAPHFLAFLEREVLLGRHEFRARQPGGLMSDTSSSAVMPATAPAIRSVASTGITR